MKLVKRLTYVGVDLITFVLFAVLLVAALIAMAPALARRRVPLHLWPAAVVYTMLHDGQPR